MPLAPPIPDHPLRGLRAGPVVAVERPGRQLVVELRPVGGELRLQPVENLLRQPARIGRRLDHQRRHRADQHRLCHPAFAVARQVVRHLAATGGVADMHGALQIQMRGQRRKIVGVMIHVVAVAGLGGPAVPTPVMGDHAEALAKEEQHLCVPIVRRKRPAMAEHDGLARAPVLVENLRAVMRGDRGMCLILFPAGSCASPI